ncbi:hypothetical protein BGZ95_003043 [Linnemannia exigua]|uniref:Late embryogenesis abundant protein LEA-2 subgroup domain-containing protein n=1 Tax=Linnemannia exigua TaxID=604196 RepID=A0AAD4D6G7_9FUNG|nr:hypothetical protein BGZ95_003043 [Linnemannia exigua]
MEHDSFLAAHNKEYLAHAQAQAQTQAQSPASRTSLQQQQPYHPSNDPYLNDPTAGGGGGYGMVNPYHYQQSPTLSAAHSGPGSDAGYTSPQLQYNQAATGGFQSYQNSPHMDNADYRQDPYRSVYAQQQHQQQLQQQQHLGSFSPYQGSMALPFDDMNQNTHHSRLSLASSSVSGASQRYPMHVFQSQGSTQALSSSFAQSRHQAGSIGPASEYGGRSEQDNEESPQRAKSDNNEGDLDENTEILARNSQSGDRSVISLSDYDKKRGGKKHQKGFSEDSDEEEGQERGENRHRDKKRCYCCSRRLCVYMTFAIILVVGIALYFLVPRAPAFSFRSVSSLGPPVITERQFRENFTLHLRVDSSESYLPLKINSIDMTVWLKIDQSKIGNNDGLPSSFVIQPKTIQVISLPMVFDYTSNIIDTNADGTYQNLLKACRTVDPTDISLIIGGKINVWGLNWIWKPQFGLNVGNIDCPVNAKDPLTDPLPPAGQPSSPPPSLPASATTTANGGTATGTLAAPSGGGGGGGGGGATTAPGTGAATPTPTAPAAPAGRTA